MKMHWCLLVFLQILCATRSDSEKENTNTSISLNPVALNSNSSWQQKRYVYEEPPFPKADLSFSALPQLFGLDDYSRCMSEPKGVYCLLDLYIANAPGQLYEYIKEYSSLSMQHYNRERLHRGVCVSERCGLSADEAQRGDQLFKCLNQSIYEQSGLQVGSMKLMYCNSANEENPPLDLLERVFAWLLATILVLTFAGTTHHLLFDAGYVEENRYALAFSLVNNWRILRCGGSGGDENFDSLQGIRFITMLLVIGAHGFLTFAGGFVSNPEFIEQLYENPLSVWVLNGRVVVQTFFVMSGFLLAHNVLKCMDTKPIRLSMLPSAIFNRALRLLPSMMLVVGAMATWVPRLNSGPVWQQAVGEERNICRSNWWKQLLFLQNYFDFDTVCLPQTWYIAADTQLYVVSFVLLVAVTQYRRHAWLMFGTILAMSLIAPALHTYFAHMMPIRASLFPETFVKLFADNNTFVSAYMSAQANWAGHTLGMITAFVYHQDLVNNWDLKNSTTMKRLYQLSIPVACIAIWVGAEFHIRSATRLEAALFNSLDHNLFAATMCVFILGCIYKCDDLMRGIVEWAPLQPLGRLSFCALLLHTVLLRTYIGHIPVLMHASYYNFATIMTSTSVLTFALSAVLYLFVEQPCCQLQKMMLERSSKKKTTNSTRQLKKVK